MGIVSIAGIKMLMLGCEIGLTKQSIPVLLTLKQLGSAALIVWMAGRQSRSGLLDTHKYSIVSGNAGKCVNEF